MFNLFLDGDGKPQRVAVGNLDELVTLDNIKEVRGYRAAEGGINQCTPARVGYRAVEGGIIQCPCARGGTLTVYGRVRRVTALRGRVFVL